MTKALILASVILSGALIRAEEPTRELRAFFRGPMALSDSQMAAISRGKAVAKVLPSKTPAEIFVFGAVFVNAAPEEYAKLAFNVDRLRKLPNYLARRRLARAGGYQGPEKLQTRQVRSAVASCGAAGASTGSRLV